MGTYVEALFHEMDFYSPQTEGHTITSIFLGGGTPTTLSSHHLVAILARCRKSFALEPELEITLEANPATIFLGELQKIREAGYNRISIGVQSFHQHELQQLERIHGTEEIYSTVHRARKAGFKNISLDLIFGLPDQTHEEWAYSLDQAISLNPEHLSAYNLTVEPGTAFHAYQTQGRLKLPDDEYQLDLFKRTIQKLGLANYEHYEISNFSKPGKTCQHNINYWNNGEYLGLGAGSSSFFQGVRFKNLNRPGEYIGNIISHGSAIESQEQPDLATAMAETLMLGLRLRKGISIKNFEKRFQISFKQTYQTVLASLLNEGLINHQNGFLNLTEKGLYLADSVILEFLPESIPLNS